MADTQMEHAVTFPNLLLWPGIALNIIFIICVFLLVHVFKYQGSTSGYSGFLTNIEKGPWIVWIFLDIS